jgi:Domain of unknown function (DUF2024)
MKIAVWDTYVKRKDGKIMHFDILVDSNATPVEKVLHFGRQYLLTKEFASPELTANECRFCHVEQAPAQIQVQIEQTGYAIIEMENC